MDDAVPQPESLLQHAEFLRSLARSLLRDEAAADDLVQETFRTAIERPPASDHNLRGWLGAVARNLARMSWRGEARRRVREQGVAQPGAVPSPAEVAERLELQEDVARAVSTLDEPHRTVVFLRHFEGVPPREIARRLGLPVSTVHTRLQRAHARLRERLDRRHGRRAWSLALAGLALPKASTAAAVGVGAALVSHRVKIGLLVLFLFGAGGVTWRATHAPGQPAARAERDGAREAARIDADEAQPKPEAEPVPSKPAALPRDRSATVELVVLDGTTGTPVADARVVVARAGRQGEERVNAALTELLKDRELATLGATLDLELLTALEFASHGALDLPLARTDGGGRVRLGDLPAGDVDMIVAHADHVPLRWRVPADGRVHEVRLARGGALRVIAPAGAHGHGCVVSSGGAVPEGTGRLDAAARCEIARLPPGRYRVSISPEVDQFRPHPTEEVTEEEVVEDEPRAALVDGIRIIADVTIREGATTTLDLTTRTLARIEGRVMDRARDGGRVVWLLDDRGLQIGTTTANDDGGFEFGSVEPGHYRAVVAPTGWGALVHHDFDVPHGVSRVTLRIEPPRGTLHGVVRHPTGKPASDVQVFVEPGDLPQNHGGATGARAILDGMAARARTDEGGAYRIEGLRAGPYRILIGGKEGFVERRVTLAAGESRPHDVSLDLDALPSLVIECYDEAGTRIQTPVALRGPAGGIAENYVLGFGLRTSAARIPPGSYSVSVAHPRFAPIVGQRFKLTTDRVLKVTLQRGVQVKIHARPGSSVELIDRHGWAYPTGGDLLRLLNEPRARKAGEFGEVVYPRVLRGLYGIRIDGKRVGSLDVGDQNVERDVTQE